MDIKIKKILNIFKKRKFWAGIVACCLFLSIFLLIFYYQLITPLGNSLEEKIFIIEEGQGLEEIANNLRTETIIKNEWIFVLYIWLLGESENLQAGRYSLSPSMNISAISEKIIKGDIISKGIKVTIPEGFSNMQIEERLVKSGIMIEGSKLPKESEGYLFPDTYYFEEDSSVEEIVKKMKDNFNKKVTDDLIIEIEGQGKKLYDILIMASLLEKEVIGDEDRAIVSGIFWKRLEDGYPLESCATIAYILGVDKWRYSYDDTRIESPYNTYINTGLTPTPINNPGILTIKAAIYPQETGYYFFLTDPETGKTIFSKTFEEHLINKGKYLE